MDEFVAETLNDGKRNMRVQFRAKFIDLAVSKRILDFPNEGEIVVRLYRALLSCIISLVRNLPDSIYQPPDDLG